MIATFHRGAERAFTLLELLVAMAVLMIMMLMIAGLADGTARVTGQSQRHISADAAARQVLDRISTDVTHAVARKDLPFRMEKNTDNDSFTFYADMNGYGGGRGVSMIGYRVTNGILYRGAQSTSWDNSSALGFTSMTNAVTDPAYLAVDDDNFETLAKDVFRLEIAFLMADGSIVTEPGMAAGGSARLASMVPDASQPQSKTIRAIIVALAAVDSQARENLNTDIMPTLLSRLPDAKPNEDILTSWNAYLADTDSTLPPPIRDSLRIYQRYIYLGN